MEASTMVKFLIGKKISNLLLFCVLLVGCGGAFESEILVTVSDTINIPNAMISSGGITTVDVNPVSNTLKNPEIQSMVYSVINNIGGAGNIGLAYTTQIIPCASVLSQANIPVVAMTNGSGILPSSFIVIANGYLTTLTPYRICIITTSTLPVQTVQADIQMSVVIKSVVSSEF